MSDYREQRTRCLTWLPVGMYPVLYLACDNERILFYLFKYDHNTPSETASYNCHVQLYTEQPDIRDRMVCASWAPKLPWILLDHVHDLVARRLCRCLYLFPGYLRAVRASITEYDNEEALVFKSRLCKVLQDIKWKELACSLHSTY